jgi:glycosyltransferase involved in cell wall biosynthesis
MIEDKRIVVIIPAHNEEESLPNVLQDLPVFIDEVIVANNGSTDSTAEVARKFGATVVAENERGYGAACLKAIEYIKNKNLSADRQDYDIVVFIDGDYSDYPEEMNRVVEPIINNDYDLVIGSRMTGKREKGAMLPQAIFGNWLASFLIKLFWKYNFTDLGPFRAIKYSSLIKLNMQDRNFGWTVEMQIKAAKQKMKTIEVPVSYRKRIGQSKVTGTVKGSVKASIKILYLIFISLFRD